MNWQNMKATVLVVTLLLCATATEVSAQSIFGFNNNYRDYTAEYTMIRIGMMVISVSLGLSLGWYCSPQAKDVRYVVVLCSGGIAVCIAIFNTGVLGWTAAWLVTFVGFFVALGYWLQRGFKALGEVPTTFGSSRWANITDVIKYKLFGTDGLYLGKFFDGEIFKAISYNSDRHGLTVAPTRSGKGIAQIINNLLTYQGSILAIDPKGENAMITAKARRDIGQDVQIVDPWNIVDVEGFETARFNPLDWLVKGDVDITENAMLLADALVMPSGNNDRFWVEEAKALLQGLILFVATDDPMEGKRHLGTVRDLLLLDGDDLQNLFQDMADSPNHIVASTGARCIQKEEKLLSNVIASAQAETHFLDSARIRENLTVSDFKFEDLKSKKMTIYLVLPADRMSAFSRWLRLMIQQAITVNARNIADKPEKPVLFLLDEMAALGRLQMIEQAYGLMAGFGMTLWSFVQDLSQLERLYGKGWQSFIANSGLISYFGSRDRMTAEYFSALCGETTVWNWSSAFSKAIGTSTGSGGAGSSSTTTTADTRAASQRKLAYPDELMRMDGSIQLLFIEDMPPLIAQKTPWFEDEDLKTKGVNLHK